MLTVRNKKAICSLQNKFCQVTSTHAQKQTQSYASANSKGQHVKVQGTRAGSMGNIPFKHTNSPLRSLVIEKKKEELWNGPGLTGVPANTAWQERQSRDDRLAQPQELPLFTKHTDGNNNT